MIIKTNQFRTKAAKPLSTFNKLSKNIHSILYSSLLATTLLATNASATSVFINELHYDNSGSDVNEGVEIAAPAGTDLSGWSVVLYNGSNGQAYSTLSLNGSSVSDQCGGYGTVTAFKESIQNGGPDGLALVNGDQVIQFLSYEGEFAATDGPASGMQSVDIGQQEVGSSAEHSLQLTGTGIGAADFTWNSPALATFGSCNVNQSFSSVDLPPQVTSISPANGTTNVPINTAVNVNFSEPVDVADGWYALSCQGGGNQSATLSGGPSQYILTPDNLFDKSDVCSLNIVADKVTDQGGSANNLTESVQSSFTLTSEDVVTACNASTTLISEIQGEGAEAGADMLDSIRNVKAVVVANFQKEADKSRQEGFYLQEEDADQDGNPLTSEGIFVHQGDSVEELSVGDVVAVTGTVAEFFGLTQLNNITEIDHCGLSNTVTPAVISLPLETAQNGVDYLERFEGMQVRLQQPLTMTESYNYGRFGQILLSNGRLYQPTHLALPGEDAKLIGEKNALNQILIDDNDSRQNPYPISNPDETVALTAEQTMRLGNQLNNDGLAVVNYSFGNYQLQPTKKFTVLKTNPRTDTLQLSADGSLKIASFNVLNYFTTLDEGASKNTCGPSADKGCRGADSAVEFERQRSKIIQAMANIDADIIGLMEIENNPNTSLENLVEGLNSIVIGGDYTYVDTGHIGTDVIKVGFIYKSSKVKTVGDFTVLNQTVDARFLDSKNRPSLIQTFEETATSERLTVVVNHLKSKGSSCEDVSDPDANDGQGNCNGTRTQAANALVDYLATDPTDSGDPDFLIIGDLNSYAKEDPISTIKAAGYENLIANASGDTGYSYVFKGVFGYLDHALANTSLEQQVSDVGVLHINSDEPRIIDYNVEHKADTQVSLMFNRDSYRSSDHDPVVITLNLSSVAPAPFCAGKAATVYVGEDGYIVGGRNDGDLFHGKLVGTNQADVIVGTDANDYILGRNGDDLICALAANDSIFAGRGDDVVFAGQGSDYIWAGQGDDLIEAGEGRDVVFGSRGRDTIAGGEGDDVIFGGSHNDILNGNAGNDYLFGSRGQDQLSGGDDNDMLFGGSANDALDGNEGVDYLFGGRGRQDSCINGFNIAGCEK